MIDNAKMYHVYFCLCKISSKIMSFITFFKTTSGHILHIMATFVLTGSLVSSKVVQGAENAKR